MAQSWKETSDETRMIDQPEFSVVVGGYASFLSNQFQCCRARSFIHIHRVRSVKNKFRRFYSEVPYNLFNLHLSNDSFASMRSAVSAKVSLHVMLFTHFKPIWGTYFGALLFSVEKQWHSRFRYMMMSFRHWTVVRSRLFLDTFDVSSHRFMNSSKDLHEWYINIKEVYLGYTCLIQPVK